MRSEQEMIDLILNTAKSLPQVDAVAMEGSRMNQHAPKDIFQDYDVVYVVNDKTSLLADRSWLAAFGPVLIQQRPEEMTLFPPTLGERFTFLTLFEDGNRIDLMLCPHSELEILLAEDPFLTVLWDPKRVFPPLPDAGDQKFWVQPPQEVLFQDCCNEFWWVSTYVVKGLWRKETLYATDHLYEICQKELLRVLSWLVGNESGWNQSFGKNFKYLPDYLDEATRQLLFEIRDFTSLTTIWQSLFTTQELFHEVAGKLAEEMGFTYDKETAEKIMQYSRSWFEDQKHIDTEIEG
ncbi:aminoglycoside 6-adenylyltransferase [Enterococcus sp. AD013-P3]|uniref:aminoglycoside 6-adenylyltransferase n=1 Tax=Enterococcus sp. AD013-P3 TaxID=3411036 RepID=UPI003B962421